MQNLYSNLREFIILPLKIRTRENDRSVGAEKKKKKKNPSR